MKLSEAIRLGAMLKPQGFGDLNIKRLFRRGSTCALGAAFEAANCPSIEVDDPTPRMGFRGSAQFSGKSQQFQIPEEWSVMYRHVSCPACTDFQVIGPLHRIIAIHLNDKHKWPRERIADWVATIEPQENSSDKQVPSEPCERIGAAADSAQRRPKSQVHEISNAIGGK